MSKCSQCRKLDKELDSWWDRLRLKMFHVFHKDIVELSQDKYTQGFSDGYKTGRTHQREANEEYLKLLEQEQPQPDTELTQFPLVVDMNKVITVNGQRQVLLNGNPIEENKLDQLKREVTLLKGSLLWDLMTNTIAHQAEEAGWKKSQNFQDLLNAKVMVRTLDIQKNIVHKIENASK